MERNIKLINLIVALLGAFFWLGIWVLYYLRYTNYSGIGLIEAVAVASGFLLEIPTGAVADIFGKKKTIILAIALASLGNFIMAIAPRVSFLFISMVVISLGTALLSGTVDALIFDSLKAMGKESTYEKVLAGTYKYNFLVMAIAGTVGGFLYKVHPALPFYATSVTFLAGMVLAFFLVEPAVDTVKFSFANYVKQNVVGFSELFKKEVSKITIVRLILIASFILITSQLLDNILGVSYGLSGEQLGVLFSITILISALASHLYPKFKNKLSRDALILISAIAVSVSLIVSPFLGVLVGASIIAGRYFFYPVVWIASSDEINKTVESKYRATTLSTFKMLEKVPYVFLSIFAGLLIDKYGGFSVSAILALGFTVIFALTYVLSW